MAAKKPAKKISKTTETKKTAVRRTSIPKKTASKKVAPQLTYEMIAHRAFCIFASPRCGSQDQNWFLAEKELKEELGI